MKAELAFVLLDEHEALLARVARGFVKRLETAQRLSELVPEEERSRGVIAAVISIPIEALRLTDDLDHRSLQISATISNARLLTQQTIIFSLADKSEISTISALAIGFVRNEHGLNLDSLAALPDDDVSKILESYARFYTGNSDFPADVIGKIQDQSRAFIEALKGVFAPLTREALFDPSHDGFAQTAFETFARFKRRSLRFAGPDISSVFQLLADPSLVSSTAELTAMRHLASDWELEEQFDCLLFARLMQGKAAEREFVSANLAIFLKDRRLTSHLSHDLLTVLGEQPVQGFPGRRRAVSRLHRQIFLSAKLAAALERRALLEIYQSIIEIFNFDRGLIKFIDWARVAAAIRRSFDITVESAFVTMLLGEPEVRLYHPKAALSMGKGALIGDLTTLLRSGGQQAASFSKLLSQIKTLPGEASRAMTQAILKRDIVERLAAALTRRSASRRPFMTVGSNTYISILRIEALRDAGTRNLMSPPSVQSEIDAEFQQVRYNYFQDRMRVGRVRIHWGEIKKAAVKILDETAPPGLLKTLGPMDAADEVVPRLKKFITEKLTTYILYDGPVSIDHALSDNLRHGIVVPRFLKTFDDALQTIARKHTLSGWEEGELTPIFGINAKEILAYRDIVADTIKDFVDSDLAVQPLGQLHRATSEGIDKVLEGYFRSDPKAKPVSPEGKLVRVVEKALKRSLGGAGRRLLDGVRRSVFAGLKDLRSNLKTSENNRTKDFLDSLETNLHGAFEEVRQWIGIAEHDREVIPFTLKEVVDLELLTTQFSELRRLKVRVSQQLIRADDTTTEEFAIRGLYLDAFESVVHNLMSNAFKYSGAKLQTDVRFHLKLSPKRLLIRAENKITAEYIGNVIREHSRTAALARKTIGPEVRQDKQSGFQKIRSSLSRVFPSGVTINIPPPSERNRVFVVEVSLDLDKDIWV